MLPSTLSVLASAGLLSLTTADDGWKTVPFYCTAMTNGKNGCVYGMTPITIPGVGAGLQNGDNKNGNIDTCTFHNAQYTSTKTGRTIMYLRDGTVPTDDSVAKVKDTRLSPRLMEYDYLIADLQMTLKIQGWVDGLDNFSLCRIQVDTNLRSDEFSCTC